MAQVHPTALVDARALLAENVTIGPYTIVGPDVSIGDGTTIGSHNVITGHTRIGANNRVFHFCSIGEANQDKKYKGEPTRVEIGDGNTIREYVSINRGTAQDKGITRVGDRNWIMAYVHIAHDCTVGSDTVFANHATLAGHVDVGDFTVLGGFVGVHQFCKVGPHVMAGVSSVVLQDVPPYLTIAGNPCAPKGINSEGLKRRGFSADAIAAIKRAYKTVYREGLRLEEAREQLQQQVNGVPELKVFLDFLSTVSRGIIR